MQEKVSKTEAVRMLVERGFVAALENGVVMVRAKNFSDVEKAIKDIGYDASWGWRAYHEVDSNRET